MVANVDGICWLCNLMHLSFWKFLFIRSLCVCIYIYIYILIEHFTFILQMNNDDIDEEFLEAQDEEI